MKTNIASLLDLTLLEKKISLQTIQSLDETARQFGVAAVCIYPEELEKLPPTSSYKRATVLNFPKGSSSKSEILQQINDLYHLHTIDEIDYVFPYHAYLEGDTFYALDHCHACYEACHSKGITFKVIMETGAYPDVNMIYQASIDIIQSGCDYLKTSTGKITIGATLAAARAILQAIYDTGIQTGIKISGGIKNKDQAQAYIALAENMLNQSVHPGWFRLGSSSLGACTK